MTALFVPECLARQAMALDCRTVADPVQYNVQASINQLDNILRSHEGRLNRDEVHTFERARTILRPFEDTSVIHGKRSRTPRFVKGHFERGIDHLGRLLSIPTFKASVDERSLSELEDAIELMQIWQGRTEPGSQGRPRSVNRQGHAPQPPTQYEKHPNEHEVVEAVRAWNRRHSSNG
jgi:hypothetical protein